jgi:acetyl esterase/lipase
VVLLSVLTMTQPEPSAGQELLTAGDVVALEAPAPDHVIAYGVDPLQFGHLRLPQGEGPFPVVIFLHGGCWLSAYDIGHVAPLEHALAEAGYAVWSLEYRRIGDQGGAWPGTYLDVAAGADHLRTLAEAHPLDLERVVAAGHSAGGHLALWLAARSKLQSDQELHTAVPLAISGVLALAPAADLEGLWQAGTCGNAVDGLMEGGPEVVPERYAQGSPMRLVPIEAEQTIFVGTHDSTWSPPALAYYQAARGAGDSRIQLVEAPESGHFEMIVPGTSTWGLVVAALAGVFARLDGR